MSAPRPSAGLWRARHRAIVQMALRQTLRWWSLISLLTVVGIGALAWWIGKPLVGGVLMVLVGTGLLWWQLAAGLLTQNHPHAARLVPGHLRQLRESTLALFWLLLTPAAAVALAVGASAGAWMAMAGAVMTLCAMTVRWPLLWFPLSGVFIGSGWLPRTWLGEHIIAALRDWHEREPLMQTIALLVAFSAVIWHLFRSGGPAHAQQWDQSQRMRRVLSGRSAPGDALPATRTGSWLSRVFTFGTTMWREHLLRTAQPTARSVLARAELAAMGNQHWSVLASSTFLVLATMGALAALTLPWLEPRHLQGVREGVSGVTIGLMSMMVAPLLGSGTALYRSRREQALLMLVPGMPRGAALNRHLARRLWLHFAACWGLGVALVIVVTLGLGGPGARLGWAAYLAAASLPGGLLLWRDWSCQGLPSPVGSLAVVMGVVSANGAMALMDHFGLLTPSLALGASVVVTLVLGAWRWRRISRLPAFWPVGRAGKS